MPLLDKLRDACDEYVKATDTKRALHAELEACGVKWQEVALIDKTFAIRLWVQEYRAKMEAGEDDSSLNLAISLHGSLRVATVQVEDFIQQHKTGESQVGTVV